MMAKNNFVAAMLLPLAMAISPTRAEPFHAKVTDQGILITENGAKVLFYQRKPKSLEGKYERANYIHPLFGLDGKNVLTEDFPKDHLHHRGVFWTWHQVRVGGKKIGDPWEIKGFSWNVVDARTEPAGDAMDLKLRVLWQSPLWTGKDGKMKPLVEEGTTIRIYPSSRSHRRIDFEIKLRALEDDVRIGGSENVKGYGGFSARLRLPKDIRFLGEFAEVQPKTNSVAAGRWMDIAASFGEDVGGVTILCHPTTPGFPQRWILRKSGSMQNPVYPGRDAVPLDRDKPTTLRYRLVIHRGPAGRNRCRQWQLDYASLYRTGADKTAAPAR